jgi:CRISPR-associated protein Csx14
MSHVYLATLGQRPEVITLALDGLLRMGYPIGAAVILHTDPIGSAITSALDSLRPVLAEYQPSITPIYRQVMRADGQPLRDITDTLSADSYHRALIHIFAEFKASASVLHLLVAGGRKAMSIYAMLAASVVFGTQDRVWTLLSEPELVARRGEYHLRAGDHNKIQMVALPILTARLAPGVDPLDAYERRADPRTDFLAKLSPAERAIAEALIQSPTNSNAELAARLGKSQSTVEKQLESIYAKMAGFYDGGESVVHKRAALVMLLRGDYPLASKTSN